MQTEAVSALPVWAQVIFYVISALGLASLGFRQYVRSGGDGDGKRKGSPSGEQQIVAGAIFDTNSMLELREALRSSTEESYHLRQALRTHCDCLNDNTDALKVLARNPRGGENK